MFYFQRWSYLDQQNTEQYKRIDEETCSMIFILKLCAESIFQPVKFLFRTNTPEAILIQGEKGIDLPLFN